MLKSHFVNLGFSLSFKNLYLLVSESLHTLVTTEIILSIVEFKTQKDHSRLLFPLDTIKVKLSSSLLPNLEQPC